MRIITHGVNGLRTMTQESDTELRGGRTENLEPGKNKEQQNKEQRSTNFPFAYSSGRRGAA